MKVRTSELIEVSVSKFMTPSAFIFLYENNLFLTFRNRTVAVWNFRGELVTSFEDHLLWHHDCSTNNIYITSDQDLIISYCKSEVVAEDGTGIILKCWLLTKKLIGLFISGIVHWYISLLDCFNIKSAIKIYVGRHYPIICHICGTYYRTSFSSVELFVDYPGMCHLQLLRLDPSTWVRLWQASALPRSLPATLPSMSYLAEMVARSGPLYGAQFQKLWRTSRRCSMMRTGTRSTLATAMAWSMCGLTR